MGVYIKGMRMPKGCYDPTVAPSYCFLLVSGICKICHKYADEYGALPTERPEGCSLVEVADRKTESNSEKSNNCETCRFELYCPEMCEGCCEWDSHYEPKDEPFDKDINVRSKDEPQNIELSKVKSELNEWRDIIGDDVVDDIISNLEEKADEDEP